MIPNSISPTRPSQTMSQFRQIYTHTLGPNQPSTQPQRSDGQVLSSPPPPQKQQEQPVIMIYDDGITHPDSPPSLAGYIDKSTPPPHQGYQSDWDPPEVQQTQPNPQKNMNPNAVRARDLGNNIISKHNWSSGLMDCINDPATFCFAFWCPCMVYQHVKNRLDYLQLNGQPSPERGGNGIGYHCLFYGMLMHICLAWPLQISTRASIRTRNGIRGSACTDCMSTSCCPPCELTQQSREMDADENNYRQMSEQTV